MNSDLEQQMRPGALSEEGFLGFDECLDDVISKDNETLRSLGLTHQQFADRLETLIQKAHRLMHDYRGRDSYWKIVEKGLLVESKYHVSWKTYMGYQGCPFGCADRAETLEFRRMALSDTDYIISNNDTGESIFFSELHLHLIRDHLFFEGNTKYRLDPETCARVLDINPGVVYTPSYMHKEYWVSNGGFCSSSCRTVDDYLRSPYVGVEERGFIKSSVPVNVGEDLYVLSNGEELLIVSVRSCKREVEIEGIPVWDLSQGLYMYKKHTFKWVEP